MPLPARLRYLLIGTVVLTLLLGARLSLRDAPATPTLFPESSAQSSGDLETASAPKTKTTPASAPRILLVSAFFPLPTSKHSPAEYDAWLANFLGEITTDIYFYTPSARESSVRALRGTRPLTLNTSFSSPFDVPPLRGREEQYDAMHAKDREGFRHTPALYAVWNAKPWLLTAALDAERAEGREYDYAFWCDAGSFRAGHAYRAWPDPARVLEVFGPTITDASDERIFIPLAGLPPRSARTWTPTAGPLDAEVSEGSFFGGSPHAAAVFAADFYAFHNAHAARGAFVGKDQTLFNALLLLHPERFRTVRVAGPLMWPLDVGALGACGSEWFYYQFVLAREEEREAMRAMWSEDAVSAARLWGGSTWWRERQRCRVAPIVGVDTLLASVFGPGWTPPAPLES